MKKSVIALVLAVIMASSSIGAASALAVETTAKEAVAVEEEVSNEQEETLDTAMTTEAAVEDEGEVSESAAEEDSDVEIAEIEEEPDSAVEIAEIEEEPEVLEEKFVTADENEAAYAGDVVDSGTCGADATWTLTGKNSNLTLTISGKGAIKAYIFYDDYVEEDYFEFFGDKIPWFDYRSSIRKVCIEEGITSIGSNAFSYCSNLASVILPESLTIIGERAFYYCNLNSIRIPSGVTSIGWHAFSCSKIYIDDLSAWVNCDVKEGPKCNLYLNNELLTDVVIPDGVTKIGSGTFRGNNSIKSISIPDSVTTIGEYAFYECSNLKTISIPKGVNEIYDYTFYKCESLTSVTMPDDLEKIGVRAFSHCNNLKEADLPKSLTSIGLEAFYRCSLSSIKYPPELTSVGNNAFAGNKITSIQFYKGTTSICDNAFSNIDNLKSVTIPEGVTSIGNNAFSGCENLTDVTIPASLKSMGRYVFYDCSLEKILISDLTSWLNIKFAGGKGSDYALYLNDRPVNDVVIPAGMEHIGDYVFSDCENLKSVTIPNSVTDIGANAFFDCRSLTSITIPESVTSIGAYAFSNCIGLKNIVVPDSVTGIEPYTFYLCTGLTTISLPSTLTYIGEYAFGKPDEYFDGDIIPGDVIDAIIVFLGTEEQWKEVSKRNVYYNTLIFSTFSVPAAFELPKSVFNYTGNPVKPGVTITYNGKQLTQGKDYKLTYENNVNIGDAYVNVNGIGEYSGSTRLGFRIRLGNSPKVTCTNVASGMKVSWEKVSGATRYKVYRDDKLIFTTSALVVTDKDVKYEGGTKYVYKVVATNRSFGDSALSKTSTYYRLMPVGIYSLTNSSAGKMTVKYDPSYGSSGYVVRYGLKSDMSDAKVITIKGQNTSSRTFSGMKKGKTYYVQVRTYKIEKGIRYYSGYCTTKKITIRK